MTQVNIPLVTRNGLTWLLIAQALIIFPHLFHLPWWILGLWLGCVIWRIQIYRMKITYPPKIVKIILVLLLGLGIYASRGTIIGLDGGVVLLVSAFSLKLIELKTKRDAVVTVYLGFFVIATAYLYGNDFLWAIYSLLPVITLLATLIGLNQTKLATHPLATIRIAIILLLQAIPLMLVLFFFFPRLEPLWSLPMPKNQQMTGLSNQMTPGELADLAQSNELVFRANFQGAIPPKNKLYWRGLTLETYNGRTWSQAWDSQYANSSRAPYWQKNTPEIAGINYNIIMQPSSNTWVIALDTPGTLPQHVLRQPDFHLERDRPIDALYSYQLTSWPDALREPNRTPRININKQLPPDRDPRAKAFGAELKSKYHGDPSQIVQALLNRFHDDSYYYTLQTPDLGKDSVDTFFFETKSGFCEHYASATAFILRAADIPARVVMGYQGGEINTSGNFVQVRQVETHAWVEYWEQGKGWVTIDPTFQVAPERIMSGLTQALNTTDQQQLSNSGFTQYGTDSWMTVLRMNWDNFNNRWDIFIATYSTDQQKGLLQSLFGKTNLMYLVVILIIGIVIISTIWLLLLFKPWKKEQNPVLRYYQKFENILSTQGLSRKPGEGPIDFGKRAAEELPQYALLITQFNRAFIAEYYAETGSIQGLKKAVTELQKAMPWKRRLFRYK